MATNPYASLNTDLQNLYNTEKNNLNKSYDEQTSMINKQTDYNLDLINQEKNYASKEFDTQKKQSNSEYEKAINPFGVNAEQMAMSGLNKSGYNQSTQARFYDTYQNKVGLLEASQAKAFQDFSNQSNQARLAGDSNLAQAAFEKYQLEVQMGWNMFNNKVSLMQNSVAWDQWNSQQKKSSSGGGGGSRGRASSSYKSSANSKQTAYNPYRMSSSGYTGAPNPTNIKGNWW